MLNSVYKRGSEPVVIARTISKAILSNNPKTRYAVGAGSKLIIFVRNVLPDRVFDKLVMKALNLKF